jgi:hypothetical protein
MHHLGYLTQEEKKMYRTRIRMGKEEGRSASRYGRNQHVACRTSQKGLLITGSRAVSLGSRAGSRGASQWEERMGRLRALAGHRGWAEDYGLRIRACCSRQAWEAQWEGVLGGVEWDLSH